jgi:hypothetical protein
MTGGSLPGLVMPPQILGCSSVFGRNYGHDACLYEPFHRLAKGVRLVRFDGRVSQGEVGHSCVVVRFVLDDPVDGLNQVAGPPVGPTAPLTHQRL